MALGVLIGALTVGSAFPHLLAAASAAVPWRMLMLMASSLAVAGRRHRRWRSSATVRTCRKRPFDPAAVRRVFAIAARGSPRSAISVTCGSSTRCGPGSPRSPRPATGGERRTPSRRRGPRSLSYDRSGAIGSAAAGAFADRVGKARIAGWAMLVERNCCAGAGLLFPRRRCAASVRRRLGRRGGGRLGAVVGARRRVQPARPRRHGADDSNVRRIPAHDGLDPAAADRRADDRLAMGVPCCRRGRFSARWRCEV